MRKTIMIFGVSSFVGSQLVKYFEKKYRIIGTFYETPVRLPGVLTLKCDVLKKDLVSRLVAQFRPDYTFYAAGLSSIIAAHAQPKLADALNSAGLINVCSASERYGAKFILISSSFVLGGEDTFYRESYTPFPSTIYGSTQASSEFYVQKSCLNYLAFRVCPLIGRGYHPIRKNWWEHLEMQIALGKQIVLDDTVFHGFLDIPTLAKVIEKAMNVEVTNRLFQLSSKDVMSRFEFAKLYCKIFKKDENLLLKGKWIFPIDDGPGKMSKQQDKYYFKMDLSNAEDFFNIKLPSIEENLLKMKQELTG